MPDEQKRTGKVLEWAKKYLTFFAVWYYSSFFFIGIFAMFILDALHPFKTETVVLSLFAIALLVELSYWRYRRWKPQKSAQFSLGATEVIELVHAEGIMRYTRNGQDYALYSNKTRAKNS